MFDPVLAEGLQSARLHRGEAGNAKSQEGVERDGVEALP